MRQFDVFRNPSPASRRYAPFVAMIQSHFIDLDSIVVAPMETDKPPSGVDVAVEHGDGSFVLALSELSPVDRQALGRTLGSLRFYEDDIRRGLEKLFTGF